MSVSPIPITGLDFSRRGSESLGELLETAAGSPQWGRASVLIQPLSQLMLLGATLDSSPLFQVGEVLLRLDPAPRAYLL